MNRRKILIVILLVLLLVVFGLMAGSGVWAVFEALEFAPNDQAAAHEWTLYGLYAIFFGCLGFLACWGLIGRYRRG